MFNQVEVQVREGDRLDTIRSCSLLRAYRVMSTDFTAMAYGSFVAETASRLAIENFPQQEMYSRLQEIFEAFGRRNPRVAALAAAYQLLEYSGMQMSYQYCAECSRELEGDGGFAFDLGGALCRDCAGSRRRELGEYGVLVICLFQSQAAWPPQRQQLSEFQPLLLLQFRDVRNII